MSVHVMVDEERKGGRKETSWRHMNMPLRIAITMARILKKPNSSSRYDVSKR